jgi:hypothetical protein
MTAGPLRRVIPEGYTVASITFVGQTPLLMSSADYDRQGDTYKAYQTLAKKRGKTDEDMARLQELEFLTRLYMDEDLGPFIPGINVKELLRSAATEQRLGEVVIREMIVPELRLPLGYDGPRDADGLWAGGFYDTRMVANGGAQKSRVERTRPCFDDWSLVAEVAWDPSYIEMGQMESIVERSKKFGLGDGRKIGFGSFDAELEFVREERHATNGDAVKMRNARDLIIQRAKQRRLDAMKVAA